MRYGEIADLRKPADGVAMRRLMDRVRAAHAEHIHPEIDNPTAALLATMPHAVDCLRLTVHDLGEAFADEFQSRRLWCREHCEGVFTVEPIWDRVGGRDTGRNFRFSNDDDAAMFRLTWVSG
jgi:hypothetical protein